MSTTIGLFEAKTHLGQIVKRAARGEEIVITDRGKPVARLVAAHEDSSQNDLVKAFERFKQLRSKALLNPPGLPKVTIKELVEEGRKW